MQFLSLLDASSTVLLAAILGVCLAFSAIRQYKLYLEDKREFDRKGIDRGMFNRVTAYGLSFALICAAVISGRAINAISYNTYMLVVLFSAAVVIFIHWVKKESAKKRDRPRTDSKQSGSE